MEQTENNAALQQNDCAKSEITESLDQSLSNPTQDSSQLSASGSDPGAGALANVEGCSLAPGEVESLGDLADPDSSTMNGPTTTMTQATTLNNNTSSSNNNNVTTKQCAGCGGNIMERFLLHAVDRYWHTACLKCSCCQAQLGEMGTSCFAKGGMILCRHDYIRLFGTTGTCASCGQSIPASEFVMRAQGNVYHLNCFTCVTCHSRLVPGDRYSIINGSLICEQDYPKVMRGHVQIPLRPSHKGLDGEHIFGSLTRCRPNRKSSRSTPDILKSNSEVC